MSGILRVIWRVAPLHPPRPRRHCGSCNATTPFVSSGRFRTNVQKKRMDVWLIYRCGACDATWNMPVVERCPVARIPPEDLDSFLHNDQAAATQHAFDLSRLARHSDRIDHDTTMTVERRIVSGEAADGATVEILIALSRPCRPRLDLLLAHELGVPRSRLAKAHEAGVLELAPVTPKAMRAPALDGQRIRIDLAGAAQWGIDPDMIWKPAV